MTADPVHHHTLLIADCTRDPDDDALSDDLRTFLVELINRLGMHVLIQPIVQYGRYGFTGLAGIVTSHIAFHYFSSTRTLQLDVYSCKEYDLNQLIEFVDSFWSIQKANLLFIRRDTEFNCRSFLYTNGQLVEGPSTVFLHSASPSSPTCPAPD